MRHVLDFDIVITALGIRCQNIESNRVTYDVIDAFLCFDLGHVQVVSIENHSQDVLRRLFIAEKQIRNGI